MTAARSELERLLGREALRAYLDTVGGGIELLPPDASDDEVGASVVVDGRVVARLVAPGGDAQSRLTVVAAGLSLAAREATARRAVSAEAIEAYRELALLYRVGDDIGSSLDPTVIGPAVLEEARRVLRADAAVIQPLGENAASVARAVYGEPRAVAQLLRDARAPMAAAASSGGAESATVGGTRGTVPRSVIAAPLTSGGGARAVLAIGRTGAAFASGEMKLVVALAQHAAGAFERASLHEANTDRLRLEHDLTLGRRIQLSLLPQVLPRADGWEIGAAYEAAREVGGDFYDVFPLRGRRATLGLVIADVTGKGIPAALMMAFARPLIRAAADQTSGPAEALILANQVLVEERRSALFITALHLRVHLRSGDIVLASAGHEPPLLVPGNGGRIRRLPAGGVLLGVRPDLPCSEHRARLAPGDLVVAYTDGVTDARRADGERFGEARLARAARASAGRSAPDAARSILEAVHRFTGTAPAADDIALLTLRRSPR